MSELDRDRMRQALAQAAGVIGLTQPNPRVGCVIGREDGQVLGVGATQPPGGPHAEVMALRDAAAQGHDVRGATAWVTLEPCAHFGRTPPCADALVRAALGRVVVAVDDPFPQVAGAGNAKLQAAGIRVDRADADLAQAAWDLNIGFFSRVLRGRPWVRVKLAASLDGRTALPNGRSQWITGEAARRDGHRWRLRATAVLTGSGTVLADDPRLDARLADNPHGWRPWRVVADRQLRCPPSAQVWAGPGRRIALAAAGESPGTAAAGPGAVPPLQAGSDRAHALQALGVEVWPLAAGDDGLDLHAVLRRLAQEGVNELHVEAGARLSAALASQDLVDEWLTYVAPLLLGPGRGMLEWPARQDPAEGLRLRLLDSHPCGDDLRLRWAPAGPERLPCPAR